MLYIHWLVHPLQRKICLVTKVCWGISRPGGYEALLWPLAPLEINIKMSFKRNATALVALAYLRRCTLQKLLMHSAINA